MICGCVAPSSDEMLSSSSSTSETFSGEVSLLRGRSPGGLMWMLITFVVLSNRTVAGCSNSTMTFAFSVPIENFAGCSTENETLVCARTTISYVGFRCETGLLGSGCACPLDVPLSFLPSTSLLLLDAW